MSVADVSPGRSGCGVVTLILAALGAVGVVGFVGAAALSTLAPTAEACIGTGQSRLVCAAGAVGLVDLDALVEKDRRIDALNGEVAARTTAADEATKRANEAEARARELDGALAGAKATAAAADQLRGEIAKRDARIAELTEKLAAPAKPGSVQLPVPVARPKPAAAPKP